MKTVVLAPKSTARTSKHTTSSARKHTHAGSKHSLRVVRETIRTVVTTVGHGRHAHTTKRTLSPGAMVGCCPAEAVAAAARLAGWEVTGEDVLDLYARCADGPSSGFTIAAALTVGVANRRCTFAPVDALDEVALPLGELGEMPALGGVVHGVEHVLGVDGRFHGLILGVELPGPHAVTVAPDGCWVSWGKHYDPADFPGAVIEEAWAVSFA